MCCDTRHVDTNSDIANCRGCGTACERNEFCATNGCLPAVIANVCKVGIVTALLDGAPPDNAAATEVLAALRMHCLPSPTTRAVDQATADVINPASGRIVVSGGESLILAGGPYFNRTVKYLESRREVPVYNGGTYPTIQFIDSTDDAVIAASTLPESTPSHDLIVIQVGRELTTGTFALVLYGFHPNGTLAAAWQFINVMLPNLEYYDESYYVYDWSDTTGDQTPNAGDTWQLLAAGT
jgi:hypothetical protein